MKTNRNQFSFVLGIIFLFSNLFLYGCNADDSTIVEPFDQFLDCQLFENVCDSLVREFQRREVKLDDSIFYYGLLAYNTISMQDHLLKRDPFGILDSLVKARITPELIEKYDIEISSGMGFYFRNWDVAMGGGPGLPRNSFWVLVRCAR